MKMTKKMWLLPLAALTLAFTACNSDESLPGTGDEMSLKNLTTTVDSTINNFPYDSLNADETAGILFLREEELVAHDVYASFNVLFPSPIFANITASELQHSELVLALITKYGLADPADAHVAGMFSNADLQILYNDMIEAGNDSLQAAIMVGALIEETDIQDLNEQIALIDGNDDIAFVYDKLLNGSIRHLKAFTKYLLVHYNVVYIPQVLNQTEYDALLATANHPGPGNGFGNGTGHGHPNHGGPHGNGGVCDSLHLGPHGNGGVCDSLHLGPHGNGGVCDSLHLGPHGGPHGDTTGTNNNHHGPHGPNSH